jgi:hypothetical protein
VIHLLPKLSRLNRNLVATAGVSLLGACATAPPAQLDDICQVFDEKRGWYKASKRSFKRWGVPIQVQMAIIYQESSFKAKAKPPRRRLFGFIPTTRLSSAYGYAQVKDATWNWYIDKTGNRGADRDNFGDAVDFIGWYGDLSQSSLGISKWDAKNQYLAYHEGHGGYRRKSFAKKGWLVRVASKVGARAKRYGAQLKGCEGRLNRGPWFWPF